MTVDPSNTPPATTGSTSTRTTTGIVSGTEWTSVDSTLLSNAATLYQSPNTGLRGLAVSTGEPLCSLHVIIATEAPTNSYSHKDDGLPHTLEHAIFLGSDLYPFKGILDKLANRSLADGTNAWTATDHTAYTLTTAGEEGALNLLPIYADHILYPTMTDESFLTEVHHVTSEGKDKGVVYCEMQGRENSDGSLVDRAILDLLYPDPCGYSSETGGKMRNLRSLTNSQVRRYHAENYTPDNVMFVLSGNVDRDEFLRVLDEVERSVRSKPPARREGRPWLSGEDGDGVPPMDLKAVGVIMPSSYSSAEDASNEDEDDTRSSTQSCNKKPLEIQFPSEDESRGTISIAWRGPKYEERREWVFLKLLWHYLTDSAASPLQKAFVECEDPLCAGVHPADEIFTEGYHQLWFTEVNVEKMELVASKLFEELREARTGFDMERMRMVVRRQRRRLLEFAERRPTDALIDAVVRNFLYAPREEALQPGEAVDLAADVDVLPLYADALNVDEQCWVDLIDRYMLSRPYAMVIGRPSAALATKIAADEKAREEQQAAELGPEKLAELGVALEQAIEFNEREIPEEVLTSVNVPSLDKVKAVPVLTIRGVGKSIGIATNSGRGISQKDSDFVLAKLRDSAKRANAEALHVDWNHIESAFLYVAIGLSSKGLCTNQRLYLPLLLELAFKLPATLDDGTTLSKDEFVSNLQNESVSYSARGGLPGSSVQQMVSFSVQVENANAKHFAIALKWIRRVLYLTDLSTEAVKIAAQRLLSEIPPQIRSGPTICRAVSHELNFDATESNQILMNVLHQWAFLEELLKRMEEESGGNEVVQELEKIRNELSKQENMQVFVAGNLKNIDDPMKTLSESLCPPGAAPDACETRGRLIKDVSSYTVRSHKTGRAVICSLSAIESSFLGITAPGVGAYDSSHASLLVAIEYLTALEGDFWVKLRGAGLTYGSSIQNTTESRLLKFGLFKCTDVAGAVAAATQILVDYASGEAKISGVGLENAKSSLAYNIISGVSTKLSAATDAWVGNYLGKQVDYDQWLLSKVAEVTIDDAMHSIINYLLPIFDPKSNIAVSCPTNKVEEISKYFTERGWVDVKTIPEEKLCKTFSNEQAKDDNGSRALPDNVAGVSMFMPGAFAAQFQCGCAKCGREGRPADK